MTVRRWSSVLAAAVLLLAACARPGTEPSGSGPPASTGSPTTSDTASPTSPTTAAPPVTLEQPAVWPAAGTVLTTSQAAATAFVETTVGVPAQLGPFMAGDTRSGEIELRFAGESGATPVVRGTLLLRMLGPDDGWFVIGAVSDGVRIDTPASAATVPAGMVDVAGSARGFEGTVIVEVFRPGQATPLDRQIAQGGSMADLAPFTATVDLADATPGRDAGDPGARRHGPRGRPRRADRDPGRRRGLSGADLGRTKARAAPDLRARTPSADLD